MDGAVESFTGGVGGGLRQWGGGGWGTRLGGRAMRVGWGGCELLQGDAGVGPWGPWGERRGSVQTHDVTSHVRWIGGGGYSRRWQIGGHPGGEIVKVRPEPLVFFVDFCNLACDGIELGYNGHNARASGTPDGEGGAFAGHDALEGIGGEVLDLVGMEL